MMLRRCLCLCVAACLTAFAGPSASADPPDGFVSLFNGRDLSGWKVPEGDHGHWKVVDGVIDYDAQSEAPGDKNLWTERSYADFVLQIDWRLKEAPYLNKNIPYILPDGTHARDIHGKEMRMALPDADSGVFLRGDGRFQTNIWCWPIGSGEMYSIRTEKQTPADVRAAVTPRHQADKPIGEWNHFEITVKGKTVKVVLNGVTVIPGATIPDLPQAGRLALQHHGGKNKQGEWAGPPSLVQFRNIYIKELPPASTSSRPASAPVRALLLTGGHDHEASFYTLFDRQDALPRLPVDTAANAFKNDLRGKYDVLILYDFTRDLDDAGKQHLREFVEAGKGLVVLHHALLDYPAWSWWADDVVGGRYRLSPVGDQPASRVANNQLFDLQPAGNHPVLNGVGPFSMTDEAYKDMLISPKVQPLLTTTNPASDRTVAWVGPCQTSRVVAIQLGHGPTAFANPAYRTLVHNAVVWAAGQNP